MERTPEGWSRELKNGVYVLTRTFQFGDFAKAMEFAVRVGAAADEADHHPEITVSWGVARVDWWSHDAKVSRRVMSRLPRRPTNCTRNAAHHERTSIRMRPETSLLISCSAVCFT